ncbi:predicted protein [Postia placenta Mad-698-R]|nr:predicted protein [Postia placenta Mad-698-R]
MPTRPRGPFCHHIGGGEGASGSPCQGRLREKTLSAPGGTEDTAGAKAAVVALRWSDFKRSECSSGLSAESAVKAPEKVRQEGYIRQGLLMQGRALSAQALAQGLEGHLLVLDRRQFERGGSWGRQGESAARRIKMRGCFGVQAARVIFLDRSGCPIWARLLLAMIEDSLRAVWDVDVDEILGVECVDLALTSSHDGWGEDGESIVGVHTTRPVGKEIKGQEVETEVPRAAEAGLYTWGDKGGLCVLVRAQLVRAQHANTAPGAVDNDTSISGI